jgi:hypothetical protein
MRNEDLLGRIVGTSLVLVGSGWIVGTSLVLVGSGWIVGLAVLLAHSETWGAPGYLLGTVFMFGLGALLIWIGWTFLRPDQEREEKFNKWRNLGRFLVKCRRTIEFLAEIGCGLMLGHAIALFLDTDWPSTAWLSILIRAPIGIGLLTLGLLAPTAYRSGPFETDVWIRWSAGMRFFMKMFLRVAWTGYLIALWDALDVHIRTLARWHESTQIVSTLLVSLLYASQVVVLHFGRIREPTPDTSA